MGFTPRVRIQTNLIRGEYGVKPQRMVLSMLPCVFCGGDQLVVLCQR